MTANINCNWSGESKSAEWTCTGSSGGAFYSTVASTAETTILKSDELTSIGQFVTATVVGAPTDFGSKATSAAAPASTSAVSQKQTPGVAARGPLPTGAVAIVGGAAGVLAAALAF